MAKRNFEVLNERKRHYRTFDDETVASLKEYYKLDDHGELLQFLKKHGMKGDIVD